MTNATTRFSDRVADYVKDRPGYPPGVLQTLRDECGIGPQYAIADIGSGTGLLSHLFLDAGNTVYGVEPNREMRQAGEQLLSDVSSFHSIDGAAEATRKRLRWPNTASIS